MPPLECGPAVYLLRAITAFRLNVTTPGRNYCLIVNSFEKNYCDKKTCWCFVKGKRAVPGSRVWIRDQAPLRFLISSVS
jgi:hypothetical protein